MKRPRTYEDDYCHPNKRYQIDYRIPIQSSVIKELTYDDLIHSSTPCFRSKHLIIDYARQQWLKDFCYNELRYGPYLHVSVGSDLFYDVADACEDWAHSRLISILQCGYFYAGTSAIRRNTLIVSEELLLHIEKSNLPGRDLFLEIEVKKELKRHLRRDHYGKIDHFEKYALYCQ